MTAQTDYYSQKLAYETDSWDLAESMSRGENIVIIDVRSEEAFRHEHIPGAVNFPHRTMNEQTCSKLSGESIYITYCDGIGCNGSTKGALNLSKHGFKVKELIGGLDWWKRDGHPTDGEYATKANAMPSCGC